VGDVLARLGELAVPGTAVQSELVAVTFPPAGRSPAGPR
jgi:hypothetical protein